MTPFTKWPTDDLPEKRTDAKAMEDFLRELEDSVEFDLKEEIVAISGIQTMIRGFYRKLMRTSFVGSWHGTKKDDPERLAKSFPEENPGELSMKIEQAGTKENPEIKDRIILGRILEVREGLGKVVKMLRLRIELYSDGSGEISAEEYENPEAKSWKGYFRKPDKLTGYANAKFDRSRGKPTSEAMLKREAPYLLDLRKEVIDTTLIKAVERFRKLMGDILTETMENGKTFAF